MSDFEAVVLGVGDTFSEKHHSTALLLVCDGFHLGDRLPGHVPHRPARRLRTRRVGRCRSRDIDDVLITHVHGDHMNGLEGFAFFKHFVEGKRTTLITSPDVRGRHLGSNGSSAPMEHALGRRAEFRQLELRQLLRFTCRSTGRTKSTVGPFRIQAAADDSPRPDQRAAGSRRAGRSFGYSSDTAFDPDLIAFLSPADLIIHETNFGPAHTAVRDAGRPSRRAPRADAADSLLRPVRYRSQRDSSFARGRRSAPLKTRTRR